MMATREDRAVLQGMGELLLSLVLKEATSKQWTDWLKVPLELALRLGDPELVSRLLVAGSVARVDLNGGHCQSGTLLRAIADRESDKDVPRSCSKGATRKNTASVNSSKPEPSIDPNKNDALHDAISQGDELGIEALLNAGVSAKAKDREGNSPLHHAVTTGGAQIVSTLLGRGADAEMPNSDGRSPLRLAVSGGHLPVVQTLLEAGAGDNPIVLDGPNGMHSLLKSASRKNHVGILKALIAHGADVNATGSDYYSALHHAAMSGKAGSIDALVEVGADVAVTNPQNGSTPLHWAVRKGHCEAMVALLGHGANVDAKDDEGRTPLYKACSIDDDRATEVAELLLIWGADQAVANNNGKTAEDCVRRRESDGATQERTRESLLQLLRSSAKERAWSRRGLLVVLCKARLGRDAVGALLGRLTTLAEEELFERSWGAGKGSRTKTKTKTKTKIREAM